VAKAVSVCGSLNSDDILSRSGCGSSTGRWARKQKQSLFSEGTWQGHLNPIGAQVRERRFLSLAN
jgi:hypothetical protein